MFDHFNFALFLGKNQLIKHFTPRYTTNDFCTTCPINMCKSSILRTYLSEHKQITNTGHHSNDDGNHGDDDVITRTVYVGDGGNDLCPVLNLRPGDLACPREGYKLSKLLAGRSVSCGVASWTDASSLVERISAVMSNC